MFLYSYSLSDWETLVNEILFPWEMLSLIIRTLGWTLNFSIPLTERSIKLSETLFVIQVIFKDLTALDKKVLTFLQSQYHLSEFLLFHWVLYSSQRGFICEKGFYYFSNSRIIGCKRRIKKKKKKTIFIIFYKICCNIFSASCKLLRIH